jgi:glycosyltransferase involved in cell wall biosynthesis
VTDTAVLHIALEPVTGPLTVIRTLAVAQRDSGSYTDVAVGVISGGAWLDSHKSIIEQSGLRFFHTWSPRCIGTLSFLLQRFRRPPIERWASELAGATGAKRVVVHFHNAWLSGAFLPLRATDIPLCSVVTFHGFAGDAALRRQPIRRWIHRYLALKLTAPEYVLTSVDRFNLPSVEAVLGLPANRFEIIPNGFPAQELSQRPFLNGAELLTVAQVGALTPEKGWRKTADAVLSLNAQGYPTRMLIAGEGPDADQARALASSHPDKIVYLGRVEDPAESVIPQADLLTLLTTNDGMPMVILEAMSCGVPPVTTRIGGIPDVVSDESSGLLIEPTQDACERALLRFHQDPELLATLCIGARLRFEAAFRIEQIVEQYQRVYRL